MPKTIQQPICLSGHLSPAHPSFCMDGATHLIHTSIVGALRLLATNAAVKNALDMYENTNQMVTVCGYVKRSANCSHIEVYHVQTSKDYIASQAPSAIAPPSAMLESQENDTFEERAQLDDEIFEDVLNCAKKIYRRERLPFILSKKPADIPTSLEKWEDIGIMIINCLRDKGYSELGSISPFKVRSFYNKPLRKFIGFLVRKID